MKTSLKTALLVLTLSSSVAFAEYLEEGTRTLRLDIYANDDSFDASSVGIEGGFGVSLYSLDDVGLFLSGYDTDDDGKFKAGGIYIEENYPINKLLAPFAGLSLGWGDVSDAPGDNPSGIFGRVQAGLNLQVSSPWSLSAAIRYSLAEKDLFPDSGSLNDNRWDVSFGVRFHY